MNLLPYHPLAYRPAVLSSVALGGFIFPFIFFVHVASQFRVYNFFEKNVQKKFEATFISKTFPPIKNYQIFFQKNKRMTSEMNV